SSHPCSFSADGFQRINPGHDKVVLDMDMLYNTKERNAFCKEWKEENGEEGEDLYKHQQRRLMFRKKIIGPPGPTGTAYFAYLVREKKDKMYKMTDRSLYGARPPFVKIFAKEEKFDGMSEDELAKRIGMTLIDNTTDCNCGAFETEIDCAESGIGCIWRPLFESCHPPELIDGGSPICPQTEAPTMAPTVTLPFEDTESPTAAAVAPDEEPSSPEADPWYTSMFKSREHESLTTESNSTEDLSLMADDDEFLEEDEPTNRKLETSSIDPLYETDLDADQRLDASERTKRNLKVESGDSWYNDDGSQREELPMKTCDSWNPSIVPRKPTWSDTWDGASLDPESRSYSAMATSRPRRLHGSFLHYQSPGNQPTFAGMFDHPSPLKDSWITSSVPINGPKYTMYQEGPRTEPVPLILPGVDHKTFVNYEEGNDYKPLRITFSTDHLLDFRKPSSDQKQRQEPVTFATISRIDALTGDILPAVSEIWAGALSILPSVDNIFPLSVGSSNQHTCGEAIIPPQHSKQGVPNTDTLIYVTVDGPQCYTNGTSRGIVSYASVCSYDQNMRPLSANIDVCLSRMEVSFGEVSEEENLRITSTLTIEVGRLLGLSPSLFHHFHNSETGKPYGSKEKLVTCVNGTERIVLVPNVLQSSLDLGMDVLSSEPYFQVNTPTVMQVVRNHFDCQSLLGARLNQDSTSCFGDSFDSRYHFDEDLTFMGGSADTAFSLSPLTLALLEDSGWYRANFQQATASTFGRGAGCGFVEGNCIGESKNTLPEYSRGFFCTDSAHRDQSLGDEPLGCDFTHNHKADCSSLEGGESNAVCPMRMANVKSCSDETNSPSLTGEVYSINSRCFETDTPSSVCLESYCNSIDFKIDIVIDEKVFQCDYEGQELSLGPYTVRCPRLAVVCPHLACPAACSGRGVCDYCLETPQCVCDNPFDATPGCYGVDPEEEATMRKLGQIIGAKEDIERELPEANKLFSHLHEEQTEYKTKFSSMLSQLLDKEDGNERELQQEDEEIYRLHSEEMNYIDKISALQSRLQNMRGEPLTNPAEEAT
ncbi:hypothetical protein ACHAWF_004971, partial [Thalassiosira exigua]